MSVSPDTKSTGGANRRARRAERELICLGTSNRMIHTASAARAASYAAWPRTRVPGARGSLRARLAVFGRARYDPGLAHGRGKQGDLVEPDETRPSPVHYLRLVRSRAPLIVLCVVLVTAAAYGYSKQKTKRYTANAALAFNDSELGEQIAGLPTNGSQNPLTQEASNLEAVKVGETAAKTAVVLGHGLTVERVDASLSVSAEGESGIINVSATSTSPTLAADIANTYANVFVKEQHSTDRQFFKSALALVNKQLAKLSPAQRFGTDGLNLIDRAQTLGLLSELGYNNVQVAQEALAPRSPSSPKTKRNTILGAVLGLLIGLGIAFLLERLDRRIKEPEDLEMIYQLPMLGVVPKSAKLARPARRGGGQVTALPPAESEAFSLIRAHLRFFNVDRDVRTLVIASPAPGDGKTTIACHLAEIAARAGSRVLLLEADLRHPTLAQQLDFQPGPGLAGVLIGAVAMPEAIQSVSYEGSPGEVAGGHTLDVLIAGAVLPPNPGELLESRAMDVLLTRAKSMYDLVVIDTPPLTIVSDAFPLLTKVDGVVIVGWVRHSRTDAAERLQQILGGSNAPLLGVVANGSEPSGIGSYVNPGHDKAPPPAGSANDITSSEQFVPTGHA
jgi:polysaccharide biosynthesis transport protein